MPDMQTSMFFNPSVQGLAGTVRTALAYRALSDTHKHTVFRYIAHPILKCAAAEPRTCHSCFYFTSLRIPPVGRYGGTVREEAGQSDRHLQLYRC